MCYSFIFLIITHTANPGLQGAMHAPGLVLIITRFRHCLWNFMTEYRNYDIDWTITWTDVLKRCIVSRLVPFDPLGTRSSVNILYGTWTSGESFRTISIGIDIQYFQWIKSISKWRLQNGCHVFQASIWQFKNVPGPLDTLDTKTSVNIGYKTALLLKISENIYILPTWVSIVCNQLVNKVKNALKQPHHMNPIFYIWRKSVIFKPRPDKTRHDKAWQCKARRGQKRPDEAAPRQEGVPRFWEILYICVEMTEWNAPKSK